MKIIVNADDFGMSHEKNIAIDQLMRKGICTNASLVVNMPYTQEAVCMAIEGGYSDKLSLHLNLTEGPSVSEEIRKIPLYYSGNSFVHRPIIKINRQIYPIYIRVVRKEIEAQIEKFLSFGLNIQSIDSHNWVHLRIPVWMALKPLIRKYGIEVVRPMWEGYKRAEIASPKWSKYFRLFQPILLRCPQCRKIGYTSNIEQFIVAEKYAKTKEYVEVFTHPDIINGQNIDTSSSYLKKEKESVEKNVAQLERYKKVSIIEMLKETR